MRRQTWRWSMVVGMLLVAAGCGDDSGGVVKDGSMSTDGAMSGDGGADGAIDSALLIDGAPGQCIGAADNTACTPTAGVTGLCSGGSCVACGGSNQDVQCVAAYGAGYLCVANNCVVAACRDSSMCSAGQLCGGNQCSACGTTPQCTGDLRYGAGFICNGGQCVMGNCQTSADCTAANAGQICGATTPSTCGACTSDAQCLGDAAYAATAPICISGKCSSASCTSGGAAVPPVACGAGTTDVCCSNACVPGSAPGIGAITCCGTGQSNCGPGSMCNNNVCNTCPAPSPANTYYVDPTNGTASGPSGANSNGCQFRSLTKVLGFLGQPTVATTVYLLGDSSAANGEVFPIVVPANVHVIGATITAGNPINTNRTVTVASSKIGFTLSRNGSTLSFLTITGANGANAKADRGVIVLGQNMAGTSIDHSTVTGFAKDGVVVGASVGTNLLPGNITLGTGFHSDANGDLTTHAFEGLVVTGSGTATINGSDGSGVTSFNGNGEHGILVGQHGSITVNGGLFLNMTPAGGKVTANNNSYAGLAIAQDPPTAGGANPLSTVNGLLVQGNPVTGNGIRIEGGSHVSLRNSLSLGNAGTGITVSTFSHMVNGTLVSSDDVSQIDLGAGIAGNDKGGNIFQVGSGASIGGRNGGAGLCLSLTANAAASLRARGNQLVNTAGTAVDCATATGTLLARRSCGPFSAIAVTGAATSNAAQVNNCSYTLP